MPDPYVRFEPDQMTLRDQLAVDRTMLANERTLLAYLRSGVALVIAGVTMMHFATGEGWFWKVGLASIPFGFGAILIGIVRFRQMSGSIARVRRHWQAVTQDPSNPPDD